MSKFYGSEVKLKMTHRFITISDTANTKIVETYAHVELVALPGGGMSIDVRGPAAYRATPESGRQFLSAAVFAVHPSERVHVATFRG